MKFYMSNTPQSVHGIAIESFMHYIMYYISQCNWFITGLQIISSNEPFLFFQWF